MSSASSNCWICNNAGDSGEHKSKKSDLKTVFGEVSPKQPIFLSDGKSHNRKVQSLDASVLKWTNVICHYCNTTRTQPHDFAWENLHAELRRRVPGLKPGDVVRASKVFPYDTTRDMLNVHLYFAKAFGCTIAMEKAPLDIVPFAKAIMTGTPHPEFYLNFGLAAGPTVPLVQASPIRIFKNPDGTLVHATWFYNVDRLVIEGRIVPGALSQKVAARQDAWHPRLGTNCLKIVRIER
jgi:hypothetical protein